MRLIDADALRTNINNVPMHGDHRVFYDIMSELVSVVAAAPTIDPVRVTGETSDGYHTFNELYHHRAVLFSVICRSRPELAWKARKHHDGTMYDGMFIVGIETPDGQATYHYDVDPYWEMFRVREFDHAPEWDGHSPAQAIERIGKIDPVKHAKWVDAKVNGMGIYPRGQRMCGECNTIIPLEWRVMPPYCFNCGARMDGEEENNG